ncbi:MAG: 23S rRNA (uracil(1939)-C(5))-methyltransferase RlmD [Candidatus Hydrogenedentota bacterium]
MRVFIEKIVHGGFGLARTEKEGVIFVPYTLAGEVVEVELMDINKNNLKLAKPLSFNVKSDSRIEPECRYFKECGGCHFQHMDYKSQKLAKFSILDDCLKRIGKIDYDKYEWVDAMDKFGYRNNFQFKVDENGHLGFYKMFSNDIVPVDKCLLANENVNKVIKILNNLLSNDNRPDEIDIRVSPQNEIYLIFKFEKNKMKQQMNSILKNIEHVAGIKVVNINNDREESSFYYSDAMQFDISEYKMVVSYDSFFQINYKVLNKIAGLINDLINSIKELPSIMIELYGGVGTFSILNFYKKFDFVIMIEESHKSCDNALTNLESNDIGNVSVWNVDVETGLARIMRQDLDSVFIFMDPPRTGLTQPVIKSILRQKPEWILSLSCEPSTFARDLSFLVKEYEIVKMYVIDMFPQTSHMETLTLLKRSC